MRVDEGRNKELPFSAGAFDAGIASPLTGYEKAVTGYSPLDIWPHCRSIVVFAVAMTP